MASRKEYTDYLIKLLNELPQKYPDKNRELLYQYGVLIGLLSQVMYSDSKTFDIVAKRLEKLKSK